jgi:hypothetical protein
MITRAVGSCDVLLALIGDQWLTAKDEDGQRRLDDPDDFVRLEIEAALTRDVRVIPILVDGARMPRAGELPASLGGLVRRQALELSPARFDFDTSRLLKVLDRTLADVRTTQVAAASLTAPEAPAPDPHTTRSSTDAAIVLASFENGTEGWLPDSDHPDIGTVSRASASTPKGPSASGSTAVVTEGWVGMARTSLLPSTSAGGAR